MPATYKALYQYLDDRYAYTVVLTFAQIEDLLGFKLPDSARVDQEWWANADPNDTPHPHSRSWTLASRTATPNLQAQTVVGSGDEDRLAGLVGYVAESEVSDLQGVTRHRVFLIGWVRRY